MTVIEANFPEDISAASLLPRGNVHPSPKTWRDQFLYFLLPDRFSDSRESTRPLFDRNSPGTHRVTNKQAWMAAGRVFQGGTISGILSKLDYLQGLGVTTLWIAPMWKQRVDLETYHGYGIQNFLEIDPRFGTRQELRDLIDEAHGIGMYVILDIIYNHSGNNWFYDINGDPQSEVDYRYSPPYDVHGWRTKLGGSSGAIGLVNDLEDGVWPRDFQKISWYTRAGKIGKWDPEDWEDPLHPSNEFRRGDFFSLKDLDLQQDSVLNAVIQVYRYWIALTDCDGFRIDTVKHVPWEASRNFCGAIHEYTESIGKDNFLLVGEVTGGASLAANYLEVLGRNVDAVLDIGEPPKRLINLAKGLWDPSPFFEQFGGSDALGSHREVGRYHVSILDDHDMVGRDKARFTAGNNISEKYQQVAHAVGIQLTTLGIPCIYYGTEQAFDGSLDNHDTTIEPRDSNGNISFDDRYIRESMFGFFSNPAQTAFGAFETSGCHFFDIQHPAYLRIAAIARLRNSDNLIGKTLRRGRQYWRETSFLNFPFRKTVRNELVAWSRILLNTEVVVAINTNGTDARGAFVSVDPNLSPVGSSLQVLYRGDWSNTDLQNLPKNLQETVVDHSGRASIRVDLPPAGMAIFSNS